MHVWKSVKTEVSCCIYDKQLSCTFVVMAEWKLGKKNGSSILNEVIYGQSLCFIEWVFVLGGSIVACEVKLELV